MILVIKLYDLFQFIASYAIQLSAVSSSHQSQTSSLTGHIYLPALFGVYTGCFIILCGILVSIEVQGSA